MEKCLDICLENRPKNVSTIGDIPSCTFWILGDDNSVENDLNGKFEVIDE